MFHKAQAPLTRRGARGFTIVEIVIACIIIGILTLVMVPVLTNKVNDARISATRQELEHLANAQERACIETGYFFRPYMLNKGLGLDGFAGIINQSSVLYLKMQTIGYQTPEVILISPTTQNFLPPGTQVAQINRMTSSTLGGWGGPYLNWKRDDNKNDWPEDSWGNDYLFFTQAGILYPPDTAAASGTGTGTGAGTGGTRATDAAFSTTGPPFSGNPGCPAGYDPTPGKQTGFDRPTWLSLGPNGVPGSGTADPADPGYGYGKGDDIIYQFAGR